MLRLDIRNFQVSSDWWRGNVGGKEGLIPDKYILLKIRGEDEARDSLVSFTCIHVKEKLLTFVSLVRRALVKTVDGQRLSPTHCGRHEVSSRSLLVYNDPTILSPPPRLPPLLLQGQLLIF